MRNYKSVLTLLSLFIACSVFAQQGDDPVILTVGNEDVPRSEFVPQPPMANSTVWVLPITIMP